MQTMRMRLNLRWFDSRVVQATLALCVALPPELPLELPSELQLELTLALLLVLLLALVLLALLLALLLVALLLAPRSADMTSAGGLLSSAREARASWTSR